MTRIRALIAVLAALAALVLLAAPADAGVTGLAVEDVQCDTATGEYVITFSLFNGVGLDEPITVLELQFDGVDQPLPTFVPNPVPAFGNSEAVVTAPGSTTSVYLAVGIGEPSEDPAFRDITEDLDGDCEADPTTTVTTAASTTTVGARPETISRPRFTG